MKATLAHLLLILMLLSITGATTSFAQAAAGDGTSSLPTASVPEGGFAKAIAGVFGSYMDFLANATSNIFSALQNEFQPFARSIVAIYIVIVSYNLFRGNTGAATTEFATSIFLIVALSGLVFESSAYQSWVFSPFTGTVTDISNFFVSKGAGVPITSQGDIFKYMGTTMDKIYEITDKMERTVGLLDSFWISIKTGFAQLVLLGVYVACIAIYLYLILQAWFAIFMYMVIGGVCIFFAAFKGTRFITVSWLRALSHEGLTIIFSSLIMGISGNIIQELIKVFALQDFGESGVFTAQFFAVFLACAMGGLMLLKAPQLAASISGGSAGSTAGVGAMVGGLAGLGFAKLKGTAAGTAGAAWGGITNKGSEASGGWAIGRNIGAGVRGAYSRMKGTSTGQG